MGTNKLAVGIVIIDKDLTSSRKIRRWDGSREVWEKSSGNLM